MAGLKLGSGTGADVPGTEGAIRSDSVWTYRSVAFYRRLCHARPRRRVKGRLVFSPAFIYADSHAEK